MGVYLNPRNDGFKESINSKIYVDKTGLIAHTNEMLGTRQKFLCISRPRRFGKSMTAEMLAAYYCRTCESRELFQNLEIARHESYETHLNKYDVITLNIQSFLSQSGDAMRVTEYLQEELMDELVEEYEGQVSIAGGGLVRALSRIHAKTGTSFVFIIDEWDCIFREKKNAVDVQNKYLEFLRSLLKDQSYVKLAYMTGILPIKKYGTHSALNMFTEYSMTEPKSLAQYVGFTEAEVVALCEAYGMDLAETKRWYDGYQVTKELSIYNPKSVVDAMLNKEFHSYWVNTETYEALKVYIELNYDGLKDTIVQLIGGSRYEIDTRKFVNDMTTFADKDDVLTLLIHLGYLAYCVETREVYIPNEEIRREYVTAIDGSGWTEVVRSIKASKELLQQTLLMNQDAVAAAIDAVHMDTTSILKYNDENALSCVISLAYYSARDAYKLVREFPTGKGFADIVFLPYKYADKPAMVVELKWDQSAEGAIAQFKEKQYAAALQDYVGEILLVGINYDREQKKHSCVIEKYQK